MPAPVIFLSLLTSAAVIAIILLIFSDLYFFFFFLFDLNSNSLFSRSFQCKRFARPSFVFFFEFIIGFISIIGTFFAFGLIAFFFSFHLAFVETFLNSAAYHFEDQRN